MKILFVDEATGELNGKKLLDFGIGFLAHDGDDHVVSFK